MTIVEVLVLRNAAASSVAITFDVLDTANRLQVSEGRHPVFALRATGPGARSARAFVGQFRAEGAPQLVVVPGLGLATEPALASGLASREAVWARRRILQAVNEGAEIATSCSGTFLVASCGLLNGRRATTSWWLRQLFHRLYPGVRLDNEALIVRDGPFTTAGAAMAQLDLMLSVVARHGGPSLANTCAQYLLIDRRHSQSRYISASALAAADERVAAAETWARDRLANDLRVEDLAAAAGLTGRTFARRVRNATGMSPVKLLQKLRVESALHLLETSRMSIEEIAFKVGYAEPSTLRRLLKRERGSSPGKIRALGPTAADA